MQFFLHAVFMCPKMMQKKALPLMASFCHFETAPLFTYAGCKPADARRLLLAALVGAAHALVALAGVAVAVRADVDRVQTADVLVAVMAAGRHGAMNGLIHDDVPPQS